MHAGALYGTLSPEISTAQPYELHDQHLQEGPADEASLEAVRSHARGRALAERDLVKLCNQFKQERPALEMGIEVAMSTSMEVVTGMVIEVTMCKGMEVTLGMGRGNQGIMHKIRMTNMQQP